MVLPLIVAACGTGSYDPSAHHRADAPTGSMLSGTDTGSIGDDGHDPSIRSNQSVTGGR